MLARTCPWPLPGCRSCSKARHSLSCQLQRKLKMAFSIAAPFSRAQTQLSGMLAAHATHNCKGWNEVVISKAKWERALPQLLEARG